MTGRLKCKHAIKSKANITCLDWGYHRRTALDNHHHESTKKRKRDHQVNGFEPDAAGKLVLAFGTSDSEINMFSAVEGRIVGTLRGTHTQGIKDFKFSHEGKRTEGWSLGGDAKLVQWDIEKGTSIRLRVTLHFGLNFLLMVYRSLAAPSPSANAICPLGSAIICASHTAYLLDPILERPKLFTASNNTVQTIITSSSNYPGSVSFLTAAESDHFMTVFDTEKSELVGTLRTENQIQSHALTTVDKLSENPLEVLSNRDNLPTQQVLLVVNKDGVLEIFPWPFYFGQSQAQKDSDTIKSRMKKKTKAAVGLIKLIRPDKSGTVVPLLDASFEGDNIVIAWTEGGVDLVFDRVQWRSEENGKLLITGTKEIVKSKDTGGFGAVTMNGVKDMGRNHVDESQTVVVNGEHAGDKQRTPDQEEIIDISSNVEDSEVNESEEEGEEMRLPSSTNADTEMKDAHIENGMGTEDQKQITLLGVEDTLMNEKDKENGEDRESEELQEPSFGELIRANAPEQIDVQATLAAPTEQQPLIPVSERSLNLPSGMSLGTVLTQSLRTNDVNLLETCLHVKNLGTVRATIERLDSSLATTLLQKLAERLYSRPGRSGRLMVWIQWTLVAHGGYLVNQPEVVKKLTSLHRVVKERANSLQPLLSLKGKLDMLEAQMNLRKSMQVRSRAMNAVDEDDDEGVIYVEGQQDSDSEMEITGKISPRQAMANRAHQEEGYNFQSEDDDEDDEDEDAEDEVRPAANDLALDAVSEATDSEEDGLIDDEASSTDQSSNPDATSSEIIDDDSLDSGLDSPSEPEAPPSKRPTKSKLSNGLVSRRT